MGPHTRFKHVCVMVFAGGVTDKKWILSEDITLSFKNVAELDECEQGDSLFLSIPYQGDLRQQIKLELAKGNHEVTVHYSAAQKEAETTFAEIEGSTIRSRIKTLRW